MKTLISLLSLSFVFFFTLSAQTTQIEANLIVMERLSNETKDYIIYAQDSVPTEGYTITTSLEEMLELDYSCWVYYVNYPDEPNGKYLIVKESNGSLLEVNTNNNEGPEDLEEWRVVTLLEFSVWKCTVYDITLTFFPLINKIIIENNEVLSPQPPTHLMLPSCILDYYIINDELHWIIPETSYDYFWKVTFLSDNEMELLFGPMPPPGVHIGLYFFICQTIFNEI